jgi:hypothetical protein
VKDIGIEGEDKTIELGLIDYKVGELIDSSSAITSVSPL